MNKELQKKEVAQAILAARTTKVVLETLLRAINELLGVAASCAFLIDAELEHLHGQVGEPTELWPEIHKIAISLDDPASMAARSALTNTPVVATEVASDPRAKQWLIRLYKPESVMAAPVSIGEKVLGSVIIMETTHVREFTGEEVATVQSLTTAAAKRLEELRKNGSS